VIQRRSPGSSRHAARWSFSAVSFDSAPANSRLLFGACRVAHT
jgi:hypothetical protein